MLFESSYTQLNLTNTVIKKSLVVQHFINCLLSVCFEDRDVDSSLATTRYPLLLDLRVSGNISPLFESTVQYIYKITTYQDIFIQGGQL
jgi:hypothetical protein